MLDARVDPARGPAMLSAYQAAAYLNLSVRTLYRLADRQRVPGPVCLGRLRRWRRVDLENWVARGCPDLAGSSSDSPSKSP